MSSSFCFFHQSYYSFSSSNSSSIFFCLSNSSCYLFFLSYSNFFRSSSSIYFSILSWKLVLSSMVIISSNLDVSYFSSKKSLRFCSDFISSFIYFILLYNLFAYAHLSSVIRFFIFLPIWRTVFVSAFNFLNLSGLFYR